MTVAGSVFQLTLYCRPARSTCAAPGLKLVFATQSFPASRQMVTLGARIGLNVPVVVGAFTIGGRKKKCALPGRQVPVAVRQFAWCAPSEISAEIRPPCDVTGRSL